jgi:uracil-DNA glycosylase family 4
VNPTLEALKFAKCDVCPLRHKRNPILGHGNVDASLAVVADSPHYADVRGKRPLAGRSGVVFENVLKREGESFETVWSTHAVLCQNQDAHYTDIPAPSGAIDCCRPRLIHELKLVQPNMILALGTTASRSTLDTRQTLKEVQGVVEFPTLFPAPVLPTYNPSSVMANNKTAESNFEDILSSTRRAVRISTGKLSIMDRTENIPVNHVKSVEQANGVLDALLAGRAGYKLSIDVETSGLSVIDNYLIQVAIGNTEKAAVFEYDVLNNPVLKRKFANLLSDSRFTWIIHNMSFDRQWFEKYFNVLPANDIDTMCMALGLTEHKGKVGLKTLSREWLNSPYYEDEVHQYLGVGKSGWENVPRPILAKYAGLDVVYTSRVEPILQQLIEEEGTVDLVRNILEPAQRTFADVESKGILVDQTYLAQLGEIWLPKIAASRQAIQQYAADNGWKRVVEDKKIRRYETVTEIKRKKVHGQMVSVPVDKEKFIGWEQLYKEEPLNPASDGQIKAFAYETLKLKKVFDEDTKNLTTGKAFRDVHKGHPLVTMLEEFTLMNHMMNTYVKGIVDDIKSDGRVHPNIDLRGAVTGRLAMHNPPLQTIPRSNTLKGGFDSIKRIFLPSPGHVWVSSDFAQLEVRCAWFLSGDDVLGQAVMTGDFHKEMASRIFKIPVDDVTDEQRQIAKTTNFGVFYGISAMGLAKNLSAEGVPITEETAQVLIDSVFEVAPKYREWYANQHKIALTEGRSRTPFGRVRRWNLITRENRQNVLNQSVNAPVQSFASDLNLLAFIKINTELQEKNLGRGLFLVHDSIECEVREGKEADAIEVIRRNMTTWPIDNPSGAVLDIEVKVGSNWGNTKVWEEA